MQNTKRLWQTPPGLVLGDATILPNSSAGPSWRYHRLASSPSLQSTPRCLIRPPSSCVQTTSKHVHVPKAAIRNLRLSGDGVLMGSGRRRNETMALQKAPCRLTPTDLANQETLPLPDQSSSSHFAPARIATGQVVTALRPPSAFDRVFRMKRL